MARTKNDVVEGAAASPEAPKGVISGKTGRPRGRPRKENKVVKTPSGRPRGRPKGSTKALSIQKAMESRGASQVEIDAAIIAGSTPKRRGRPRRDDVTTPAQTGTGRTTSTKAKASSTPNSTGKRGRGRPKKSAPESPKEEEPVKDDEEVTSAAEDGEHQPTFPC